MRNEDSTEFNVLIYMYYLHLIHYNFNYKLNEYKVNNLQL